MGRMKWQDAISGCGYVDISAVLLELVELYSIEQTNRILRRFGVDRLIFATDYPDVRFTTPEKIYAQKPVDSGFFYTKLTTVVPYRRNGGLISLLDSYDITNL